MSDLSRSTIVAAMGLAVLNGDAKASAALTREVPIAGYIAPAMDEVGRRIECKEYFVPELL